MFLYFVFFAPAFFVGGCVSDDAPVLSEDGGLDSVRCPPAGRWRIGEMHTRSGLTPGQVQRVGSAHSGDLLGCLMKHRVKGRPLAAEFELVFFINADGCVTRTEMRRFFLNGVGSGVKMCLLQEVLTWRFPRPVSGQIVEARFPFAVQGH